MPTTKQVAKLCADFKSGIETIFVSKDNKQEYIEIDDSVRQGDYKYTYSDNYATAVKSEQADLVVSAVERFAQVIPLNIEEIFLWYFEQKGVDNPERFLMQQGVNNQFPLLAGEGQGEVSGINRQSAPSPLTPLPQGEGNVLNPENPINQIIKLMSQTKKNFDISDVISKLRNKKSRKDK